MPVATKKTVGQKLKEDAEDQGESSYSISDGTGIPRPTVRDILAGDVENPGWKNVVEIADYLGRDLNDLTE